MARKTSKIARIEAEYAQSPVVTDAQIALITHTPEPFNAGPLLTSFAPAPWQAAATYISEQFALPKSEMDSPAIVASTLNAIETGEPTEAEIAAALREIDPAMEHAATAGVVDHESQLGSWMPLDAAEEALEERELEEIAALDDGIEPEVTLDQARSAIADEDAKKMVWKIKNEVDARETFEIEAAEAEKGDVNPNILRTLKKVRQQMVTLRAGRLLCSLQVDPAFINRSVNEGFRYNVYALGKLSDVIYGVTDGQIANAINLAICRSIFAFNRAGLSFTMEHAKGACSKQYALKKLTAAARAHLVSHTVSESTAPTQASSTLQALTTLGVVKTDGAGKNATFKLTDAPITKKLQALLAA